MKKNNPGKNFSDLKINSFWKYDSEDKVFVSLNNSTICFKSWLADEILPSLSVHGFPPSIGSLLILQSAINDPIQLGVLVDFLQSGIKPENKAVLNESLRVLKLISQLPAEVKELKKLKHLYLAIFEKCHNRLSVKMSQQAMLSLKADNWEPNTLFETPYIETDLMVDLIPFFQVSHKIKSFEDLIQWVAGYSKINEAIVPDTRMKEVEVNPNSWLEELIRNPETAPEASLIQRIWSGLNIPMHTPASGLSALGGVSDLTNKGQYDKLLISEFANDDLVFLSRLANQEALFLNREKPPDKHPKHRTVLIDVSLKNWGNSKSISFSFAMALGMHPSQSYMYTYFVVGEKAIEVTFDSIQKCIEAFAAADLTLNATTGIMEYFQEFHTHSTDVIYIGNQECLTDQTIVNLQSALNNQFIHYWIHPDHNGKIEIYSGFKNGRKRIQNFELPVKEIWETKKRQISVNEPVFNSKIHEIKSPFLIPNNAISSKGKLFLDWDLNPGFITRYGEYIVPFCTAYPGNKGWEVKLKNIPFKPEQVAAGIIPEGRVICNYKRSQFCLYILNVDTLECKEYRLNVKIKLAEIFIYEKQIWIIGEHSNCIRVDYNGNFYYPGPDDPVMSMIEAFNEYKVALSKIYTGGVSILLNGKNVFINQAGKFCISNHCLTESHNHLYLERNTDKSVRAQALIVGHNYFRFNNGSEVKLEESGLIRLIPANQQSVITITSVINTPVTGIYEKYLFGNPFFLKDEKYYSVYLENKPLDFQERIKDKSVGYFPYYLLHKILKMPNDSRYELATGLNENLADYIVKELKNFSVDCVKVQVNLEEENEFIRKPDLFLLTEQIRLFVQNIISA